MNIEILKLIYHDYSNEDVVRECSLNYLKNFGYEMDSVQTHKYTEDIQNNDIAVAVRHIGNNEEYAYLFFKTECRGSNILFVLSQVYFDEKLRETSIRLIVSNTFDMLFRNNIQYEDYARANGQYPFYFPHKDETIAKICNEIINVWRVKTGGIESNPTFMDAVNKEKDKMNIK